MIKSITIDTALIDVLDDGQIADYVRIKCAEVDSVEVAVAAPVEVAPAPPESAPEPKAAPSMLGRSSRKGHNSSNPALKPAG